MLKNNLLGILWTIFIVVICGIPGEKLPESSFFGDLPIDKIVHFGLYFILFLLVYSGLLSQKFKLATLGAFVYSFVVGIVVELLQSYFFEGRSGDWFDVIANTSGIAVAWLTYGYFSGLIPFLRKKNE